MSRWVILSEHEITEKLRAGQVEATLNNGQYTLKVNSENEEYLKEYIKYSAPQIKPLDRENGAPVMPSKIERQVISLPEPFAKKKDSLGNSLFKRIHGSETVEIVAGEEGVLEIEIGYGWAKIEAMEIIGCGKDHTADLFILDTATNTYSGYPVELAGEHLTLNQFSYDTNIREGFYRFSSKYDADLYMGMVVQLVVKNNSDTSSKVSLNIELNEVVL